MRIAAVIAFLLFGFAAVVQWNDPDPGIWSAAYLVAAVSAACAFFGVISVPFSVLCAVVYGVFAWTLYPSGGSGSGFDLSKFSMSSSGVEEMREAGGLALCTVWWVALAVYGRRSRAQHTPAVAACAVVVLGGLACSARTPVSTYPMDDHVVVVPASPEKQLVSRTRVATDLQNPRGMLPRSDRELVVAVAGTGRTEDGGTGGLLVLVDRDGDQIFDTRRTLLDGQESRNVIDVVRRDEVFGMAGMAEGAGTTLVSLAYFGGPSSIYRLDGDEVAPWSEVFGNINDLDFDTARGRWFGVSSSSDEVVLLRPERGSERVLKIPPLPDGQDPVPGYLSYDASQDELLVTLFSGSTRGEEGGTGIELETRAGGIVRVNPETGDLAWVVTGLTAPTDLEIGPDGRLYVLEFCSQFEDPLETRADMWKEPSHGGFRRFSGRLLAIDREAGNVTVVAEGLDGPTNLALRGRDLYIAQGMGTPGRPIPGPGGGIPLTGFIERLELPAGVDGEKGA